MTDLKKAEQAIAFLTLSTRKQKMREVTDRVIQSCSTSSMLSHLLFCQDAWFDIYEDAEGGGSHYDRNLDFFNGPYEDFCVVQNMEFGYWSIALVRNGREDWIGSLII